MIQQMSTGISFAIRVAQVAMETFLYRALFLTAVSKNCVAS